jgi:hypothetical protein
MQRVTRLILLPLGALALAACSSQVSLGDPTPGVHPVDPGGTTPPVLAIPDPKPELTYPEGPYGKTAGSVIPNLSWEGYKNGTGDWGTISLLDYYDPDGSKGINAIKVNLAATW